VWFEQNQGQTDSVWIIYPKKTAGGQFAYADIVDEALCFGWIDSLPRKLDNERSMILVSPRKVGSGWSRVNKDKIVRLIAEGRMAPPGLAKIEAAKADGSWDRLDAVDALQEPDDLQFALRVDPRAEENWRAFPPSARRGILEWITNAKTEATRKKRIHQTASLAAQNKRANQWPQDKA
jgi:uncharacterized protein YdeI (YjbR/CyaY-like superfamily)